MTDKQIKCFLELAKTLNFSRAAKNLHMNQSSLSTHIRTLEKHYGFPLFYRSTKRVELTEEGIIMLQVLEKLQTEHGEALSHARQVFQSGTLKIGYMSGRETHAFLKAVVDDFFQQRGDIPVEVIRKEAEALMRGIEDDTLDVAFVTRNMAQRSHGQGSVLVYQAPQYIMYSKLHEQRDEGFAIEDFEQTVFYLLPEDKDPTGYDCVREIGAKYGLHFNIKEVHSTESMIMNIGMNGGAGIADSTFRIYGSVGAQIGFWEIPGERYIDYVAVYNDNESKRVKREFIQYLSEKYAECCESENFQK